MVNRNCVFYRHALGLHQEETIEKLVRGLARLGLARLGLARLGLARLGLARLGLARLGLARLGLARPGDFRNTLSATHRPPKIAGWASQWHAIPKWAALRTTPNEMKKTIITAILR